MILGGYLSRSGLLLSLLMFMPYLVVAQESESSLQLRLAGGDFYPLEQAVSANVETSAAGKIYLVAMTSAPLRPEQRRMLESTGAELLGYLPENGYRLRVPLQFENALKSLPFVEWLGELPPHFKVLPQIAEAASSQTADTRFRVVLAAGEPPYRVLQVLDGLSVEAVPAGKDCAWRVVTTVPASAIAGTVSAVAALPEVEAIEPAPLVLPLNQDGVWVHQSFVGPSPQETPVFDNGIFGCDQIISVADTAQDHDSCYFADDINGPPPVYECVTPPCPVETPDVGMRKDIIYYHWETGDVGEEDTCPTLIGGGYGHGTHTSGSIAGDMEPYADCTGFTSPNRNGGDGQAPGARLVVFELGDDIEYLNNLGGTIWNIVDVAYGSGARIHSFSFGGVCYDKWGQCVSGCTLPYDSLARDADLAMWTYPDLLLVNAVGNGGTYCPPPNSVVTPAVGKNLLVVGGLEHGLSADDVMEESSRGPVFDGRLRPTISAQGRAVVSAASDASLHTDNCDTCSLEGTSMSAPTTAGLAALVREYYKAGFHATGLRNPAQGLTPSGALLKATLISGAVDLTAPGPDFDSGFGRLLLKETLAFDGAPFQLRIDDHRDGIITGSVVNHAYDVTSAEEFRATLVWTDYPAELIAALARVNEIRLQVTEPNGDVWFQTIDPVTDAPSQTMNDSNPHDSLNTEEHLVFADPAPGRWAVQVVGVDVPWGPQPFALVVRGALTDCPAPDAPEAPTLSTPAERQVEISWTAVPGAAAYDIYRSFGSCPGGPWIQVAGGVTGTSWIDSDVSGGVEYSYHLTATSDATGFCESEPSPCASVVPTGECFLLPKFRGITSVSSDGVENCSITLAWNPATPYCVGGVVYNVYRSTSPSFTPSPANRIAACVPGTSYTDTDNLVHAVDYYYTVRAEDSTSDHGGPCNGGNEDANTARESAAPYGPPASGTWSDDAGDTAEAKFELGPSWSIDSASGNSDPNAYQGASSQYICTDLTSPVLTLAEPGEGPQLSFATIHNLDYDPAYIWLFEGSLGQVEIATGPDFANWTRVPLSPDYPAYIDGPFNNCPTTQTVGYYFSDIDMDYDTYTASLVNWGGNDVRIRFHLSGDLYFPGGNWWIDDVQVTKTLVPGSCSTVTAGPPPIPDGASVSGTPFLVDKSGADLLMTWDSTTCPATEVNIYRGVIGNFSAFTTGNCGLPPTGSAILNPPDDSWFLVVATDGAATDGSWSRDAAGTELNYTGSSDACPTITQHVPGGVCP